MTRPKRPWEVSVFESQASRAGIAFERNSLVPHGKALMACSSRAACIIVSAETAEELAPDDDSALWGAIARHGSRSSAAALVNLPTFGGNGTVEPISTESPAYHLAEYALSRASSFEPVEQEDMVEAKVSVWGPDGRLVWQSAPKDYLSSSRDYDGYYRLFLDERVPQVLRLDELRSDLIRALTSGVVGELEGHHDSQLVVRASGSSPVVVNDRGGRVARVESGVGIPPSDEILVVADELNRPAATRVLANAGFTLPFDPVDGWLRGASVRPGIHAWVYVTWKGEVAGRKVELELARLRSRSGRLTVFASELAKPVELLLQRVGLRVLEVQVANHPDDPECLFGVDLFSTVERPRLRTLRPEARKLIPPDWADQLELAWHSDPETLKPPTLRMLDAPNRYETTFEDVSGAECCDCRLCDGPGYTTRPPATFSLPGYCYDCCADAFWGVFSDEGSDQPWFGAVIWALQTLAEIEFGGAPAFEQVVTPPEEGPNSDLLMLCRMLIARAGSSVLGAERKSRGWTDWLGAAGLLTGGTRTSRGVTVVAKDGHVCRSLFERSIDDFLYDNGIDHETEPLYPFDSEMNRNGYRADWKLLDGSFVEALGFVRDRVYMEKVERKLKLADRHSISVITITDADVANLASIFAKWLPKDYVRPLRSAPLRREVPAEGPRSAALNTLDEVTTHVGVGRVGRCLRAVELQEGGATRREIAEHFGVTLLTVKSLLRDGRFYADPDSDPTRLARAVVVVAEQNKGVRRSEFQARAGWTDSQVRQLWRDASFLRERDASAPDTRGESGGEPICSPDL